MKQLADEHRAATMVERMLSRFSHETCSYHRRLLSLLGLSATFLAFACSPFVDWSSFAPTNAETPTSPEGGSNTPSGGAEGGADSASNTDGSADTSYRDLVVSDHPILYVRGAPGTGKNTVRDETGGPDVPLPTSGVTFGEGVTTGSPALTFTGATNVSVPTRAALDFAGVAEHTLEVWLNLSQAPSPADNFFLLDHERFDPRIGWNLSVGFDGFYYERRGMDVNQVRAGSAGPNTWHHVVAVKDTSRMLLYVDGALLSSQQASASVTATTSATLIGGLNCAYCETNNFRGRLSEIAIYDHALDAARAHAHYCALRSCP